jgi:hypothetical protein
MFSQEVHDYVGAIYGARSIVTMAVFTKLSDDDGKAERYWYVCNIVVVSDDDQSKTLVVLEEARVPVIIQQLYALIKANGSRIIHGADGSMSLRMPNIGASASDDGPDATMAYVSSYEGIGAFVAGLKVTSYDALQQKLAAFGKLFRLFGLPQNRIVIRALFVGQRWRELAREKAKSRAL